MCHNSAVTGVLRAITTKTIPTILPEAVNHTVPAHTQARVAMENSLPQAKVSHHLCG